MSTEASYRFERTVDPGGTVRALDRACELIAEFSEGAVEVCEGVIDAYPNPIEEMEVRLRPARANALLGLALSGEEMAAHLRRLRLEVDDEGETLRVRVPTFRQDLRTEIDLVEEVARAHGYENIPETLPQASAGVGALPPELEFEREVRKLLRGLGLSEAVTSSLESPEALDRIGLPEGDPRRRAVRIANWKTADRSQLRTTSLTSLLEVVAYNRRHGVEAVSVFDLGRVYLSQSEHELPREPRRLGIAVTGTMDVGRWQPPQELASWDFYALKGVVENVLRAAARVPGEFAPADDPVLHPGRSAEVSLDGEPVGMLGEVLPEVREAYDLSDPVFVAELDLDALEKHVGGAPRYKPVSRYPAVTRDVAFSLTFRRTDRTLTDDEVDDVMDRVRSALTEELGAQIRE
jgi:phenylalanyl-tRNA synthetase beta chain